VSSSKSGGCVALVQESIIYYMGQNASSNGVPPLDLRLRSSYDFLIRTDVA